MKNGVMEEVRRLFKPEFLNRIDEMIVFHSLNKEHMKEILRLMLQTLNKRVMASMDIRLNLTPSAKEYLMRKGYDEKYGARPLRRALQTELEDGLAEAILAGHVKPGDNIRVSCVKNKIIFSVKD